MTERSKLATWLYDANIARRLGGHPFAVGLDRMPMYGFFQTMASRSPLIAKLGLDTVLDATPETPTVLLPDRLGFNGKEPSLPFQLVWNYLNGLYPDVCSVDDIDWQANSSEETHIWPLLTLDQKYAVLYYAGVFDIPIQTSFVSTYVSLFLEDLEDVLSKEIGIGPISSDEPRAWTRFAKVAYEVRPLISDKESLTWIISERYRQDLEQPNIKDRVPLTYMEILPSDDGTFSYESLKTALSESSTDQPVMVEVHEYVEGLPKKLLGAWTVQNVRNLTPEQITGVRPDEISDSPYGFGLELVLMYHRYGGHYLFVTAKSGEDKIGLFACPGSGRSLWLAPALKESPDEDLYVKPRFFKA